MVHLDRLLRATTKNEKGQLFKEKSAPRQNPGYVYAGGALANVYKLRLNNFCSALGGVQVHPLHLLATPMDDGGAGGNRGFITREPSWSLLNRFQQDDVSVLPFCTNDDRIVGQNAHVVSRRR